MREEATGYEEEEPSETPPPGGADARRRAGPATAGNAGPGNAGPENTGPWQACPEHPRPRRPGSRSAAPLLAGVRLRQRPPQEKAPEDSRQRRLPPRRRPPRPLPPAGQPAGPTQREAVERDHLHGAVAERDLVEGVEAAEFDRTYGGASSARASEGPNRIFDFADRLAARAEERKQTGPKPRLETCLKFSLGGETFAMPVEPVQQIVRISSITRVPHAPRPIRGVTNLRGRVIPVIDLRVRVGLPAAEIDRSSRIIAVGSRGRVIGLLVDSVQQVMHLDLNLIQRPPEDVLTQQGDYIAGVYHQGESLILLLDVDRALIVRDTSAA